MQSDKTRPLGAKKSVSFETLFFAFLPSQMRQLFHRRGVSFETLFFPGFAPEQLPPQEQEQGQPPQPPLRRFRIPQSRIAASTTTTRAPVRIVPII